jgi:uncharacterized peroxidase-related enzyme
MWIHHIPYEESEGKLRELYDRVKGPNDNVDNIMLAHSLRPHTMEGHMTLYKHVLHHSKNAIPTWFLEAIGVYVSILNGCAYCLEHHSAGMGRWLNDEHRAAAIREALETGDLEKAFDGKHATALEYARKLTETPGRIREENVQALREAGWEDGEILEINQVASYFNYVNRTALGLGVTTEGDVLGLSPIDADSPEDWHHR